MRMLVSGWAMAAMPILFGASLGHAVPSSAASDHAMVQTAAFGDAPGGHRHRKQAQDEQPAKPETPQAHAQPETDAQHRAYLNRYGFGQ